MKPLTDDHSSHEKKQAISGVFWLGSERISNLVINLISGIILARLLEPQDFGIVALATAVARLISRFAGIGLLPEVMRLQESHRDYKDFLSTYFWLNLFMVSALAILGTVFMYVTSFLQGDTFAVFCIVLLGWSLNNIFTPFRSLLLKNMRFREIFFLAFVPALLSTIVAVGMAMRGWGKWSLVVPQMIFLGLAAATAFPLSGFRPRFCFHAGSARFLLKRSPWYIISNFTEEGIEHIDDVFLGKMASSVILGFYQRAYLVAVLFHKNIGTVLNNVLMPFFFYHAEQRYKVEKIYSATVKIVIYGIGGLLSILLWYCPEIISFVYGEKWLPAVPILYAITVYIFALPLYHVNKNLTIAQGEIARTGRISIEIFTVAVVALYPFIHYCKAIGAALAMDCALFYGLVRMVVLARRSCPVNIFETYLKPIALTGLGFLVGWLLKYLFVPVIGTWQAFSLNIVFICAWMVSVIIVCERVILSSFIKTKIP